MTHARTLYRERSLICKSLATREAFFDTGTIPWSTLTKEVSDSKIITVRGAGSINGIDLPEATRLLNDELIPRISKCLVTQPVAIFYDGDQDNPLKPDVGFITGRLLDRFGNNQQGVTFFVAQKRSWYYPDRQNRNLQNNNGQDYVTYIFEDDTYKGDHSSFTQAEELVGLEGYEQWYIGALGNIATEQLLDFNKKIPSGQKRKAVLFRARNNTNLEPEFREMLHVARQRNDGPGITKFENAITQRQNIYGVGWNNCGIPCIDRSNLSNLDLEFVIPR
jgi:hypothetical protein